MIHLWRSFTFRTSNAKLPIERGRWYDIPRENRLCTICNCIEIGDEFHYLLHTFTHNQMFTKFQQLFNTNNK